MHACACLVTGYIDLGLEYRTHGEYVRLGEQLVAAATAGGHEVQTFGGCVEDCWHWSLSEGAEMPIGNPLKDTRAFHAVQHQKTSWVAKAALTTDAETLCWIDFGLLHVAGITADMISPFLDRVACQAPRDKVGMASIWGEPQSIPGWQTPEWWCAGGVFTVPRSLAFSWHDAVVDRAVAARADGHITWEVNTWAAAWSRWSRVVQPWLCDHDKTLLDNGP